MASFRVTNVNVPKSFPAVTYGREIDRCPVFSGEIVELIISWGSDVYSWAIDGTNNIRVVILVKTVCELAELSVFSWYLDHHRHHLLEDHVYESLHSIMSSGYRNTELLWDCSANKKKCIQRAVLEVGTGFFIKFSSVLSKHRKTFEVQCQMLIWSQNQKLFCWLCTVQTPWIVYKAAQSVFAGLVSTLFGALVLTVGLGCNIATSLDDTILPNIQLFVSCS